MSTTIEAKCCCGDVTDLKATFLYLSESGLLWIPHHDVARLKSEYDEEYASKRVDGLSFQFELAHKPEPLFRIEATGFIDVDGGLQFSRLTQHGLRLDFWNGRDHTQCNGFIFIPSSNIIAIHDVSIPFIIGLHGEITRRKARVT